MDAGSRQENASKRKSGTDPADGCCHRL